jgi:predicted nucleic acid-binding Zn ribbon protein
VDNGVTVRPIGAANQAKSGDLNPRPSVDQNETDADATVRNQRPLRGSDLARAALDAARAAAKTPGKPAGSGASRRRNTMGTGSRRRRRWSASGPDERDPQPLGRLAARLVTDRGWNGRLASGRVFDRWARIVGNDVAEHATPVTLQDGVLAVRAESTAWATQLRLLQPQLLAKITAAVGPGVVKRLKVQGPAAPSWRYGQRHVSGRGPRDTYG